ncbi:hypothetical protein QQX98_004346 [Neonectria punicea]|uniref:2-deoxy-D-gluconate 3-dehydrogenase n=1 Tax=Neonectria punicea TaxID=979145 RepID=A0ABR1HBE0_9HYPO
MATLTAAPTPNVPALDLFSLKGKNALVTGGSRGIGAAMAHALSDAGASLCLAQRDVSNTATADAIRAKGTRVEIVSCDLTSMGDVKGVFQKALDVLDVNLQALFFICQSAGQHMIPRKTGKIVNVASINSFIGGEIITSYSASKGAVAQLTKALSNEWAKHNIQVNAIAPGSIATDM